MRLSVREPANYGVYVRKRDSLLTNIPRPNPSLHRRTNRMPIRRLRKLPPYAPYTSINVKRNWHSPRYARQQCQSTNIPSPAALERAYILHAPVSKSSSWNDLETLNPSLLPPPCCKTTVARAANAHMRRWNSRRCMVRLRPHRPCVHRTTKLRLQGVRSELNHWGWRTLPRSFCGCKRRTK